MLKSILLTGLISLPGLAAAHGDTHAAPAAKQGVAAPVRASVSKPELLAPFMIQTILDGDHVPGDVLLVRCNFTESTPCRGISISLSDSAGTKVLVGHSGSDGWVGFQGLSKDLEYKVKIESAKYTGEFSVRAGAVERIAALRIEGRE